jgi:histidine kinase
MNSALETVSMLGLRERRRLERDLHDGAQQRLVSLALTLRMAREKLGPDAGEAGRPLDRSRQELDEALKELATLPRPRPGRDARLGAARRAGRPLLPLSGGRPLCSGPPWPWSGDDSPDSSASASPMLSGAAAGQTTSRGTDGWDGRFNRSLATPTTAPQRVPPCARASPIATSRGASTAPLLRRACDWLRVGVL